MQIRIDSKTIILSCESEPLEVAKSGTIEHVQDVVLAKNDWLESFNKFFNLFF
jgi:hypothetical protein